MADVKISQLPAATTPLDGTEVLPIVQSATTKQVSIANVTAGRAMAASSLTLTTPLAVTSGGTGLSTTAAGTLFSSTALNTVAATATPTLGVAGTTAGTLTLSGGTSGTVTLKTALAAGTNTIFQFPATNGTNNYILTTNGSGVTDWTNPTALGIDLDVGGTAITGATDKYVLYNNNGTLGNYAVTGTGTTVVLSTSPTFTTGFTSPLHIGGTTASSSLTLQSTSGVGTSDSIVFRVGNNGATTAATIDTSGNFGIGGITPGTRLDVAGLIRTRNAGYNLSIGTTQKAIFGTYDYISGSGTDYTPTLFAETGLGYYFLVNGTATKAMTLDASGNLGIGITTPGSKIDIASGSGTAVTAVTIRSLAGNSNGFKIVTNSSTDDVSLVNYYAAPLIFGTNNTERARFNAGAPILCLSGGSTTATGTGIAFPATQSASSDVNTLDDYEEGTWTPTVTPLTGSLTAYTSSGSYRKVGGMVSVSFIFTITTVGTAAGVAKISNLPFGFSGANVSSGGARENAISGINGGIVAASTTEIYVAKYDGGTPFTVNYAWVCQMTYPV